MNRGVFAAIGVFLVFSAIHMKDGLFRRPHVVFWRLVMGVNVLYLMLIVFLLFQDLDDARAWLALVDPKLGRPLEERAYGRSVT